RLSNSYEDKNNVSLIVFVYTSSFFADIPTPIMSAKNTKAPYTIITTPKRTFRLLKTFPFPPYIRNAIKRTTIKNNITSSPVIVYIKHFINPSPAFLHTSIPFYSLHFIQNGFPSFALKLYTGFKCCFISTVSQCYQQY